MRDDRTEASILLFEFLQVCNNLGRITHYPGLVLLRLESAFVADLQLACTQVDQADENLLRRTSPGKKTVKPALDVLEVCIPATSNLPSLVSVSDVFRILLLAVLFRTCTEPEAIRDLGDQSSRLSGTVRFQVDGVNEFLVHGSPFY